MCQPFAVTFDRACTSVLLLHLFDLNVQMLLRWYGVMYRYGLHVLGPIASPSLKRLMQIVSVFTPLPGLHHRHDPPKIIRIT